MANTSNAAVASAGSTSRNKPTVAPTPKSSKAAKQTVRGLSPADGKSREAGTMETTKVTPNPTNIATTPRLTVDSGAFGIDAYRNGGFDGGGSSDPMVHKYTLSDYERDEEAAKIWLVSNTDGAELVTAYSRFFLQAVQESESEKYQVVETFTHFYSFFYGKRPPIYRYSGVLIDDPNFRWANEFRFMYDNFFRGTQASELNATCLIKYSGRSVNGLIVGLNMGQQALDPKVVQFSIDVLVLDYNVTDAFSADIAGLLAAKQKELQALKATLERELAEINKNIPTEQRLAAGQVFAGKKGGSTGKKPGTKDKPVDQQAPSGGKYTLVTPKNTT